MKLALVGKERREAEPGLDGLCSVCGAGLIAKCGHLRVWHWSHRAVRTCDRWWEPETEWHRNWKNQFPLDWQELVQYAEDGERHIADVKTAAGVVIEFQHSSLCREERASREAFYRKMVWVVDGLRRKRDRPGFFASLRGPRIVNLKPLTYLLQPEKTPLLRDWWESTAPVFLDFGGNIERDETPRFAVPVLWRLDPIKSRSGAYLTPVRKDSFADKHANGSSLKGFDLSATFARRARARAHFREDAPEMFRRRAFAEYLARKDAVRRRGRF